MLAKIYLSLLLVFFGVLSQGITGTFSEKDIDESSKLLVRQKRVINRLPGGDIKQNIRSTPYIVIIKTFRNPHSCIGVILTQHIVLTAAKCVEIQIDRYYKVISGVSQAAGARRYVSHTAKDIRILVGQHPHRPADGIALLTVTPTFIFSAKTQNIQLYEGSIQPGTLATVSGWGCNAEGQPGTAHPQHLRSITVPIISLQRCATLYNQRSVISESDICTLDPTGMQYCGATDSGAPLVVKIGNVSQLAGIHLWNEGGRSYPDVFINLQNPRYKTWIAENIHTI